MNQRKSKISLHKLLSVINYKWIYPKQLSLVPLKLLLSENLLNQNGILHINCIESLQVIKVGWELLPYLLAIRFSPLDLLIGLLNFLIWLLANWKYHLQAILIQSEEYSSLKGILIYFHAERINLLNVGIYKWIKLSEIIMGIWVEYIVSKFIRV